MNCPIFTFCIKSIFYVLMMLICYRQVSFCSDSPGRFHEKHTFLLLLWELYSSLNSVSHGNLFDSQCCFTQLDNLEKVWIVHLRDCFRLLTRYIESQIHRNDPVLLLRTSQLFVNFSLLLFLQSHLNKLVTGPQFHLHHTGTLHWCSISGRQG